MGYAYEAFAQAELIAGNADRVKDHLGSAWKHAQMVIGDEDKALLVNDLKTLE